MYARGYSIHEALIKLLPAWFDISGIEIDLALNWIGSYHTDMRQKVKICESLSDNYTLQLGVPQGSVLEQILFTLYTTPLFSETPTGEPHITLCCFHNDDFQLAMEMILITWWL